MPSAKLIKALEKEGFELEFPSYDSNDEIIIEILREDNLRLRLSLVLFLYQSFDYKNIISKLNSEEIKEFNRIILISKNIYSQNNVENDLDRIIRENKIKMEYTKQDFDNFYAAFKEAMLRKNKEAEKIIQKQSKLRLNLDLNQSLQVLFSPAKVRIMQKMFNYEKLTNTELKYYYRAISNINKAVLNPSLQDYLRIIEISKKYT
jgi:hypothetical protein